MGKIKVAIAALLVIVLFASSLSSTAIYYANVISDKDSKMSALQSQVSNLQSQIAMLQSQIESAKTANIVTSLGVIDIPADKTYQMYPSDNKSHVWITGTIFNAGGGWALNPKLQVLAFDENGKQLMNTTTSVRNGVWDAERNSKGIYFNSGEFNDMCPQQNTTVSLSIYHEGFFPNSTTYRIVPLWTD
jgi:hypothetical protein